MTQKSPYFADIIMIFPPGGDSRSSDFGHGLGSAYIIAYLQKMGVDAIPFVDHSPMTVSECAQKVLNYHPRIVGFTVFNSNYLQCVLLARHIKYIDPKVLIVFGGPVPTIMPEQIMLDNESIDICVLGFGEEVFLNLVQELSHNDYNLSLVNLTRLNSVAYRRDKHIRFNPIVDIGSRDALSSNGLDKYPSPYLASIIPPDQASRIGIVTARGCNQNCTFCNCALLTGKKILYHSVDRVIDELEFLSHCRGNQSPITIHDDTFTLIPGRTQEICELILKKNIKVHLACSTRCDRVSEELLDLMRRAGFTSIGFSLESAVPRVLRAIGKVHKAEDVPSDGLEKERRFLRSLKKMTVYAKKIGMESVFVSIMVGLPGEIPEEAKHTVDMVRNLDIDYYIHNIFSIYPGTPIYFNHKRYGYKLNYLGDHKIFTETIHPYDVRTSVKMAPAATHYAKARSIDQANLSILAFTPQRFNEKNHFNNVILCLDLIHPQLVDWLQECLVINGSIIHIYSNKKRFLEYANRNLSSLYKCFSPSLNYHQYIQSCDHCNYRALIPIKRSFAIEDEPGLSIKYMTTTLALAAYEQNGLDLRTTIVTDDGIDDSLTLHGLLLHLSNQDDIYQYLTENKAYPFFLHLCRWTKSSANCQNFETAIIRADDSVSVCWHGGAIGRVGMSASDMLQNLKKMQLEIHQSRKCAACQKEDMCIKCIFPFPLSGDSFCGLKKAYATNDQAEKLRSFERFKDILHPI